ncbi:MAG: hypothetical protein PA3071, partial [uncultured Friedmanniella sp.]
GDPRPRTVLPAAQRSAGGRARCPSDPGPGAAARRRRVGAGRADAGDHPAEQARTGGGAAPAGAHHRAAPGGLPARRPPRPAARPGLGDQRRPRLHRRRGRRPQDRLGRHRPDDGAVRARHDVGPRARGVGPAGRDAVDELGDRGRHQARPRHRRHRHHRLPQPEDGRPVRGLRHAPGLAAPDAGPFRPLRALRPAPLHADRALRAGPRHRLDVPGRGHRAAVPDAAATGPAGRRLRLPHPGRPRARSERRARVGAFDAPAGRPEPGAGHRGRRPARGRVPRRRRHADPRPRDRLRALREHRRPRRPGPDGCRQRRPAGTDPDRPSSCRCRPHPAAHGQGLGGRHRPIRAGLPPGGQHAARAAPGSDQV